MEESVIYLLSLAMSGSFRKGQDNKQDGLLANKRQK